LNGGFRLDNGIAIVTTGMLMIVSARYQGKGTHG